MGRYRPERDGGLAKVGAAAGGGGAGWAAGQRDGAGRAATQDTTRGITDPPGARSLIVPGMNRLTCPTESHAPRCVPPMVPEHIGYVLHVSVRTPARKMREIAR